MINPDDWCTITYTERVKTDFKLQGICGSKRWFFVNSIETYKMSENIKKVDLQKRLEWMKITKLKNSTKRKFINIKVIPFKID
jgi:hypothetical protein